MVKGALACLLAGIFLASMISAIPQGADSEIPELPSTEEIFGWIEDISSMGYRRPGTPVDIEARGYIMDKLLEFGFEDVRDETIDINDGFMLWRADEWGLMVNVEKYLSFFIPYTAHTPPEGITAEIVYIGEAIEEDDVVENRIVVADIRFMETDVDLLVNFSYFDYDPGDTAVGLTRTATWARKNFKQYEELGVYGEAYEAGAVGFIGILRDYPTNTNKYYAPYDGVMKPIPGLWVSRDDGSHLRELLETATDPVYATMRLTGCIDTTATTGNIVGILPGKTDDAIIVCSHHDGPWYSAVEDASGVAEVLAIAKYFAQVPEEHREKTLIFILQAGHFYGAIGGKTFIKDHPDLMEKTILAIAIEHIAEDFDVIDGEWVDTGYVEPRAMFTTGNPLLVRFSEEAIIKHDLRRTSILQTGSPLGVPTDGSMYYRAGVPIYSFISSPEYLFDLEDTPDKVAKDQLVPVAKAFIDIINRVDDTPANLIRNSPPVPPPTLTIPPLPPYPGLGRVHQGHGSIDVGDSYKGSGALYIRPSYTDTEQIWGPQDLVYLGVGDSGWLGPWKIVEHWQEDWLLYECRGESGILWVLVYGTFIMAVGDGIFFTGNVA